MKLNKVMWLVRITLIALLAVGLVGTVSLAAHTAHAADDPTPTPVAPGQGQGQGQGQRQNQEHGQGQGGADKVLEKWLEREKRALEQQDHRLEVANRVAEKAQKWIENLKERGKDTAGLEAGLAAFNEQIALAQASHDAAANLLAAPAGFDAQGKVVDRQTARETIRAIRQTLREAHRAIVKAVPIFRHAVNEYRRANRPAGHDDGGNENGNGNNGNGNGNNGGDDIGE